MSDLIVQLYRSLNIDNDAHIDLIIENAKKNKISYDEHKYYYDFDIDGWNNYIDLLLQVCQQHPTSENLIDCYLDYIYFDKIENYKITMNIFRRHCRNLVYVCPQWADKIVDKICGLSYWDQNDWKAIAPHTSNEKIIKWSRKLIEIDENSETQNLEDSLLCLIEYCPILSLNAIECLIDYDVNSKIVETIANFAPNHLDYFIEKIFEKYEDAYYKISVKVASNILKFSPKWKDEVIKWIRHTIDLNQLVEVKQTIEASQPIKSDEYKDASDDQGVQEIVVTSKKNKPFFFD